MKVSIRPPSEKALRDYLQKQSSADYSYPEVGATTESFPRGYDHDSNRVLLGQGVRDFQLAKTALRAWKMFPPSWVTIYPVKPPIKAGQVVVVLFRLFGIRWFNSCRIVYTLDSKHQFGFAYGTLPGHVERGEECFQVYMDAQEQVWYQIEAFSIPGVWLTRLTYPLPRLFQKRFVRHSFQGMKKAVEDAR